MRGRARRRALVMTRPFWNKVALNSRGVATLLQKGHAQIIESTVVYYTSWFAGVSVLAMYRTAPMVISRSS